MIYVMLQNVHVKHKRGKPDICVRSFPFKGEPIKVARSSYVRANKHFKRTTIDVTNSLSYLDVNAKSLRREVGIVFKKNKNKKRKCTDNSNGHDTFGTLRSYSRKKQCTSDRTGDQLKDGPIKV